MSLILGHFSVPHVTAAPQRTQTMQTLSSAFDPLVGSSSTTPRNHYVLQMSAKQKGNGYCKCSLPQLTSLTSQTFHHQCTELESTCKRENSGRVCNTAGETVYSIVPSQVFIKKKKKKKKRLLVWLGSSLDSSSLTDYHAVMKIKSSTESDFQAEAGAPTNQDQEEVGVFGGADGFQIFFFFWWRGWHGLRGFCSFCSFCALELNFPCCWSCNETKSAKSKESRQRWINDALMFTSFAAKP